jgi:thiamine biosynthesis protein ThiI
MTKCLLVRYAEIGIKGKNRLVFEKKLVSNIKTIFSQNKLGFSQITRPRGRVIIFTEHTGNILKRVFGIVNYSPAVQTSIDKSMTDAAIKLSGVRQGKTFRVTCQRLDKTLPFTSNDVARDLGAELVKQTKAKVNLTDYDIEVCIELIEGKAYVFTQRIPCFGGLPINSQARLLALIEKPQDELAALLLLKRGCDIVPVCFKKKPLKLLRAFGCLNKPVMVCCLEDLEGIAQEKKAFGLVTGEMLEQFKPMPSSLMVLRPLIAYDKEQVKVKLDEFKAALK